MILAKIAFRNIFRQKRRSFLTGLTMAVGFALLSVSISISEGTYDNVINMFTRAYTGHVQINKKGYLDKPSLYRTFDDIDYLGGKIENVKHVKSWSPRIFASALSFIGKKTTVARIVGIDPKKESETTTIEKKIAKGRYLSLKPKKEVMIGGVLAEILNADVGDELVLISQGADGSIANDIFKISAILKGDSSSLERINCYMHVEDAQEFLELYNRYHEIIILLDDFSRSFEIAAQLRQVIKNPDLDIQPWEKVHRQFYETMMADKEGMWIALLIIVIIVAIGVLNTVLMAILERTPEFGVLKALGTKPRQILSMIILETSFLSLMAIAAGLIISVIANYILRGHGINYPEPVDLSGFVVTTLYGSLKLKVFLIPSLITFITAIAVSIIPAVRAMRIVPVKAMRAH